MSGDEMHVSPPLRKALLNTGSVILCLLLRSVRDRAWRLLCHCL